MVTLIQFFGEEPKIKVMNLFLNNPEEKYTKSAICRLTGVSRSTLQEMCKEFFKLKLLKKRGYCYYLNKYDKIVKMFLKFKEAIENVPYTD